MIKIENEIWKLNIDEIDLNILKNLYSLKPKEKITTVSLAKKIFEIDNKYDMVKIDNFIRYRLEKLYKMGLLVKDVCNGKMMYMVNLNNVKIKNGKISILVGDKKVEIKNF